MRTEQRPSIVRTEQRLCIFKGSCARSPVTERLVLGATMSAPDSSTANVVPLFFHIFEEFPKNQCLKMRTEQRFAFLTDSAKLAPLWAGQQMQGLGGWPLRKRSGGGEDPPRNDPLFWVAPVASVAPVAPVASL